MDLQNIELDKAVIKQHNAITSGRYDYDAAQLDVLFMVLALIDEKNPSHREITIYAKDIEKITGRSWNYQHLKETTEAMGSRMFEIEMPDRFRQLWLFSFVDYHLGTGSFTVKINEEAMPYFFELRNTFTMLSLKSILSCKSKFSKRLYALACQWRKVGFKEFSIKELKLMLGLLNSKTGDEQYYNNFGGFKRDVLNVAEEQINEFTDINIRFLPIKCGRSYKKVAMYIDRVEKETQLLIDFNKTIEENKIEAVRKTFLKTVISCGISEAYAELIVQHSTINEFENIKAETLDKMRKGEIKTEAHRYIVGIYQKKGILPAKGEKSRTSADGALVAQIAEAIAKGKTKK